LRGKGESLVLGKENLGGGGGLVNVVSSVWQVSRKEGKKGLDRKNREGKGGGDLLGYGSKEFVKSRRLNTRE